MTKTQPRRPWAIVALIVAAVSFGCFRAPLRGPGYGPEGDAYLHDDYAEVGALASERAYRLLLVGDAGKPSASDPTLELVGKWGNEHPERTAVLFLGDNIYPAGLRDSARERDERVLLQQLNSTDAYKVFMPGNHDWGFAWNRMQAPGVLRNQQEFIESHAEKNANFEPESGCPGPVPMELLPPGDQLSGGLTVLVLDLHWWLLDEDQRPVCEGIATTSDFVDRLRSELEARRGRNVVVAAHHPIRSGGPHGGHTRGFWFDLGVAIFYRIFTAQDLIEPEYREMIGVLSEVLAETRPLAMVGGHDHNLQILDGGDAAELVIVSGSASKVSSVTSIEGTLFAHAQKGFVVLDFYEASDEHPEVLLAQAVEIGRAAPVARVLLNLAREQADPVRVSAPSAPEALIPSAPDPTP